MKEKKLTPEEKARNREQIERLREARRMIAEITIHGGSIQTWCEGSANFQKAFEQEKALLRRGHPCDWRVEEYGWTEFVIDLLEDTLDDWLQGERE